MWESTNLNQTEHEKSLLLHQIIDCVLHAAAVHFPRDKIAHPLDVSLRKEFAMLTVHRVLTTSAVLIATLPAFAQTTGQTTGPRKAALGTGSNFAQVYTVEFTVTNLQTLADGTKITRETREVEARDSQGRTRREMTDNWPGTSDPFTSVQVTDPVENAQISWDSQRRVANLVKLPVPDQRTGCWSSDTGNISVRYTVSAARSSLSISSDPGPASPGATIISANSHAESNDPNLLPLITQKTVIKVDPNSPKSEDLGTKTILGIEAHGYRYTTTTPVGEVGNDKPIVHTSEVWRSPLLPFPVRETMNDPRSGRRIKEPVKLSLTEPDLAAFQPPQGMDVRTTELHQVPCQH
jgi:hypothetical protein